MSFFTGLREKVKRVKGAEWAVLLIALGLAGSLLLSPGTLLFGGTAAPAAETESGAQGALEKRLSRVLSSIEGAGKVEVVIYCAKPVAAAADSWLSPATSAQEEGEPAGAVVVAEGAGDLKVRLQLAQAVQTLLRLDADAVEIFKMGGVEKEE